MQQLQIQTVITIPPEFVVIEKTEYDRLVSNDEVGSWWTLKDLEEKTNRKAKWLKENIFEHYRFREKINVENGGFVKYPNGGKSGYLFLASKTKEFLEENFVNILRSDEDAI